MATTTMHYGVEIDLPALADADGGRKWFQERLASLAVDYMPWWYTYRVQLADLCRAANLPPFHALFHWIPPRCMCVGERDTPLLIDATERAMDDWFDDLFMWMQVVFVACDRVARPPLAKAQIDARLYVKRGQNIQNAVRRVRRLQAGERLAVVDIPSSACFMMIGNQWSPVETFEETLHASFIDAGLIDLRDRATRRVHVHCRRRNPVDAAAQ